MTEPEMERERVGNQLETNTKTIQPKSFFKTKAGKWTIGIIIVSAFIIIGAVLSGTYEDLDSGNIGSSEKNPVYQCDDYEIDMPKGWSASGESDLLTIQDEMGQFVMIASIKDFPSNAQPLVESMVLDKIEAQGQKIGEPVKVKIANKEGTLYPLANSSFNSFTIFTSNEEVYYQITGLQKIGSKDVTNIIETFRFK